MVFWVSSHKTSQSFEPLKSNAKFMTVYLIVAQGDRLLNCKPAPKVTFVVSRRDLKRMMNAGPDHFRKGHLNLKGTISVMSFLENMMPTIWIKHYFLFIYFLLSCITLTSHHFSRSQHIKKVWLNDKWYHFLYIFNLDSDRSESCQFVIINLLKGFRVAQWENVHRIIRRSQILSL